MPMPREGNLARGEKGEYAVRRILKSGDAAVSCEAQEKGTGRKVFLKLYIAPTSRSDWFRPYLDYERELNRRLSEDDYLRDVSVPACDVFAAPLLGADGRPLSKHPSICQVFRWIEGGFTLKDATSRPAGEPEPDWATRVYLAKIFVSALERLHARNVVHADLKPENVGLEPVELESGKKRLRPTLLDMDFSVLADRTAPWHGKLGYTGTLGYHSPEHLRGEVPRKASDVFTAAVILCELLAGRHPFLSAFEGETDELKRRMREGETDFSGDAIPLLGPCGAELPALLRLALSPDPEERPTAGQLSKNLARLRRSLAGGGSPRFGWFFDPAAVPGVEAGRVEPKTSTAVAVAPVRTAEDVTAAEPVREEAPPPRPSKLVLRGKIGAIRTRTALAPNRALLSRVIGDDARFTDGRPQFEVIPAGGGWIVRPTSPLNPTFLNGSPLRAPAALKDGDVLSIQSVYARISVSFAA